ncbi:MAG: 3'(2'),5'-bisphosphate nucleotidase CysQ [bacterium]
MRKKIVVDVFRLCDFALQAGNKIMEIYKSGDIATEKKKDDSPLTIADKASHNIIVQTLSENYPDIPVLSEEGSKSNYQTRSKWNRFFLVDPLDGTKEFISRNGEFTVNIAYLEDNYPVMGVIYVPVFETLYYTQNHNSFKQNSEGKREKLQVNKNTKKGVIAVRSRSHTSPEEEKFFAANNVTDTIAKGSSLKFCMVAEGRAHLYYRHGPTMEWDTAAGHAIAKAAGADVEGLSYNKKVLRNSSFYVTAINLEKEKDTVV